MRMVGRFAKRTTALRKHGCDTGNDGGINMDALNNTINMVSDYSRVSNALMTDVPVRDLQR